MRFLLAAGDAPVQLLHPLRYWGYEFWSGLGSDFGELTLVVSAITGLVLAIRFYRTHLTCHVTTCNRPATHHVVGTPYRTCAPHHPTVPDGEITAEHIAQAHADVLAIIDKKGPS